jgi:hypothetical protein
MRDVFPQVHALCLVDVTGEATEFGIIENDLLIENNFISYGSNTFLRDVVKKTEKPHTDVLSHLQAYDADVALEPADFKEHMQLYEAEVKTALLDILERCALPSHIVLTAHHPFKKIFKHVLENALESVTEKKIPVTSLDENVLPESKNDLDADVYLVLGARFFHKLHGCTDIND